MRPDTSGEAPGLHAAFGFAGAFGKGRADFGLQGINEKRSLPCQELPFNMEERMASGQNSRLAATGGKTDHAEADHQQCPCRRLGNIGGQRNGIETALPAGRVQRDCDRAAGIGRGGGVARGKGRPVTRRWGDTRCKHAAAANAQKNAARVAKVVADTELRRQRIGTTRNRGRHKGL